MNGKVQGIIICGVVIACLGGTLLFLDKTGDNSTSSTADSSSTVKSKVDESVLLIDTSSDKISKISVENSFGSYTMSHPDNGKTVWVIDELAGLNQLSTMQSGLADNITQFEAYKKVVDSTDDLGKYGLENPQGKFTVEFSDGTSRTFLVGDVSTQTRYTYLCEEGDTAVYMMLNSRISYFIDPKENFVNTTLIPNTDEDLEYGKLTVKRADLDYDIAFETDPYNNEGMVSAQVMSEPIFSYLNVSVSTTTTHGMWGLSANSVEKIFPTDETFKEYGLDDPYCTVTFVGKGYDYTLKIGKEIYAKNSEGEDTTNIGAYYCYVTGADGIDCIWQVGIDSLPWATIDPSDVITSLMTSNNIVGVTQVKVKGDGRDITYNVDADGESIVNGITQNGEKIDIELFKGLYQYLLVCPTNEIYFTDPTGESYLTVEIVCADGHTDTMEFFTDSSRRSIIKLNGRTSFRIQSKWVEQFYKNIENVENGKEIVDNY